MMACPPAVMQQEQTFYKALEDVTGWQLEPTTDKLLLTDTDGNVLVRFASHNS